MRTPTPTHLWSHSHCCFPSLQTVPARLPPRVTLRWVLGARDESDPARYHVPSSRTQHLGVRGLDRSPPGALWVDPGSTPSHLLESQGSGHLPYPPVIPWVQDRQVDGGTVPPITGRSSTPDSRPGWASSPTSAQVVPRGLLLPSGGRASGPHRKGEATFPPPRPRWWQRGERRPACSLWLTLANSLLQGP